jgi:hypothetical protein
VTFSFGFYNSLDGDRKYDAEDISKMFDTILTDGVMRGYGSEFLVTAAGGLGLTIGEGRAWLRHTWTLNSDPYPYVAEAADAANNRIDAVCLEVNRSAAVRANKIVTVRGNAATPTIRPTLINSDDTQQYPLAWVTRRAGLATVAQSDIVQAVGSTLTPYATNRLLDPTFEPATMHRNTFRGKNLGGVVTAAQKAAIATGSLEELWIGDYWTINGIRWRIVDFNYFKQARAGGSAINPPHAVVMPDTNILTTRYADSATYLGGYVQSTLDKVVGPATLAKAAFGANLLEFRTKQVNAIDGSGSPTGDGYYIVANSVPTAAQMFGVSPFARNVSTDAPTQFALFRLDPSFIYAAPRNAADVSPATWLRDMATPGLAYAIQHPPYDVFSVTAIRNIAGARPFHLVR